MNISECSGGNLGTAQSRHLSRVIKMKDPVSIMVLGEITNDSDSMSPFILGRNKDGYIDCLKDVVRTGQIEWLLEDPMSAKRTLYHVREAGKFHRRCETCLGPHRL